MYDAICRYALYGERVELVYYLDCMMDILCREIDESKELEKKRKEGEERPTATAKKNDETTEEGTTQRKQNTQSRIVRVQEQARVEQEQARVQEQEQVREAQVQEQVREAQMAWQTSRKNVNERSMQPQHAMQQSVQSSSVQSSSVRVHAVKPPLFRDVGIDEAVNALRRDEAWCELVKKRFGVSNCKMAERLEEFILHCKAKGKERHGSQEDLKAHFCSWLRIRKDIEKRQTENGKCKEGGFSFTRRRGFEPTTPEVTEYTERL